jgi:hypothetical protein
MEIYPKLEHFSYFCLGGGILYRTSLQGWQKHSQGSHPDVYRDRDAVKGGIFDFLANF